MRLDNGKIVTKILRNGEPITLSFSNTNQWEEWRRVTLDNVNPYPERYITVFEWKGDQPVAQYSINSKFWASNIIKCNEWSKS